MSEPIGWLWRKATRAAPERARRWVSKAAGLRPPPDTRAIAWRTGTVSGVELRTGPVQECALPSEPAMWSQHGPTIWRAERFQGLPHFYPVYRYGDLYSYSLFSLILHKGNLRLDPKVAREVETRTYPTSPDTGQSTGTSAGWAVRSRATGASEARMSSPAGWRRPWSGTRPRSSG